MLSAGTQCLITCFLCTRKRRAYENRSCALLPDGLEISGSVDLMGQIAELVSMTGFDCMSLYYFTN